MVEISRPWDGTVTGDATLAPYDAPTEWSEVWMAMLNMGRIANRGGVCFKELNSYAITAAAGSVDVASGRAFVYGTEHQSNAVVNIAIPTPVIGTRQDRIVLRKDWVAQTVRIYRHVGTDGGGTPENLEQTAGVAWEIPLGVVSITTGGVITVLPEGNAGGGVSYPGRMWYPIPNLSTPLLSIRNNANQNIPDATSTVITFNTVVNEDIDDMWDVGTPGTVTIRTPGLYLIQGRIAFQSAGAFATSPGIWMRLNGDSINEVQVYLAQGTLLATTNLHADFSVMEKFAAGEFFDFRTLMTGGSGGTIVANTDRPYYPRIDVRWMSPLGVS